MKDSDEMTHRRLRGLVESYRLDVESDLRAVRDRSGVRQRRRRWVKVGVAAVAALSLSVPTMVAGYVLGGGLRAPLDAADLGSPLSAPQSIPERWGGTLLWSVGDKSARADSVSSSWALPPEIHGGVLSPNGPEGGVYAFHGEVPPGDFPAMWYPDASTVDVKLPFSEAYDLTLPSWSPDGRRLAAEICHVEGDGQSCSVLLISPADGSSAELVPSNSQGLSWSPDGSEIAFIGSDRALSVVDVRSGATRRLLPLEGFADLLRPAWSPSGDFIAVIARKGDDYLPVVLSADGSVLASGKGEPGSPPRLAWRQGMDTLLVAQEEFGAGGTVATSVSQLSGPGWTPTLLIRLQGQGRPELWSSPNGEALLLESQDQEILASTGGVGGFPYRWTVLEVDTGIVDQWDLNGKQVLGWE